MNPSLKVLTRPSQLEHLIDGTIVSWERVRGDRTSRAVAIVNIEIEHHDKCEDADVSDCACQRVVWVSPGGWAPQAPESAGIEYPCWALGTLDELTEPWRMDQVPMSVMPDPPTFIAPTLDIGGTYPRDAALDAAARVWQGTGAQARHVCTTADVYVEWLLAAPPAPTPDVDPASPGYLFHDDNDLTGKFGHQPNYVGGQSSVPVSYGPDAVTADRLRMAKELRTALSTLAEAAELHGLPLTIAMRARINGLADTLDSQAQRTMDGM